MSRLTLGLKLKELRLDIS